MFIGKDIEISLRAFLRRSSHLAVAGAASSYALGLAGMGEAAAFSTAGGYKALVCVFLYGGNDHANTFIPFDEATPDDLKLRRIHAGVFLVMISNDYLIQR